MKFLPSSKTGGFAMLTLCVLLGVLAGTGGYTFYYAQGASYLSNDPKACVNCHIMRPQYDSWHKSSHHAVATCNDCHTPHDLVGKYVSKARNGYFHSKAFTLENFHEPIQITKTNRDILLRNCIDCHRSVVSGITGHAGQDWPDGETVFDCIRCHQSVGHGP